MPLIHQIRRYKLILDVFADFFVCLFLYLCTRKDLEDYRVAWEEPVTTRLPGLGYTLLSSPPPGSGAVMASILGVVAEYSPGPADRENTTAWHRFVEACKYAFARRTVMGDWAYLPIQEEVRDLYL